jgi:hypothetical protein
MNNIAPEVLRKEIEDYITRLRFLKEESLKIEGVITYLQSLLNNQK